MLFTFSSTLLFLIAIIGSSHGQIEKCELRLISQPIDHFSFSDSIGNYNQRVFFSKEFYAVGGPLFFYTGNESPVEAYIRNTGFMWESAKSMKGLIVFAEHRYYGYSQPFNPESCTNTDTLRYLSATQALADFAAVITSFTEEFKTVGTIVMGGSYGGMLSAWMRVKYPYLVDGAIASSAPVLSFVGMNPPVDDYAFNRHMARTAGETCTRGVKAAVTRVMELGQTKGGRELISQMFRTCHPIMTEDEVNSNLIGWMMDPWEFYTMGNYPYPSSYMVDAFINGKGDPVTLPAWPLKVACSPLSEVVEKELLADDVVLLTAMRDTMSVWYNKTRTETCYFNGEDNQRRHSRMTSRSYPRKQMRESDKSLSQLVHDTAYNCGNWDYQSCAELMMPFSSGSDEDFVFPVSKFNFTTASTTCREQWGVSPVVGFAVREYGNYNTYRQASNIFFANGDLDPWTPLCVDCSTPDQLCGSGNDVISAVVEGGAHHLDLMFSNPEDPESVMSVRMSQREYIMKWVQQARDRKR
mmetsp:Transcript_25947/g.26155  ORF Transcript_25947/g.26155 Transcript_25947/m.26155 type:complete len:525 (+) Transcript_25947:88-1662(+)